MDFQGDLEAYIGGRSSLIQIVSHEWEVVEGTITRVIRSLDDGREYLKWSESMGMQFFENGEPKELTEDQRAEFARLINPVSVLQWYVGDPGTEGQGAFGYDKSSILHLEDVHHFMDANHP